MIKGYWYWIRRPGLVNEDLVRRLRCKKFVDDKCVLFRGRLPWRTIALVAYDEEGDRNKVIVDEAPPPIWRPLLRRKYWRRVAERKA